MAQIMIEVEIPEGATADDIRQALTAAADRLSEDWGKETLPDTGRHVSVARLDGRPAALVTINGHDFAPVPLWEE